MSFRFLCPSCGEESLAAKVLIGRRVRCPRCGELVEAAPTLETLEETRTDTAPASQPETAPPTRTTAKKKTTRPAKPGEPALQQEGEKATPSAATEGAVEHEAVVFAAREQREEAEMDMTPMVDVTFLLLIFFMVTAAFSLQKSIAVPNPNRDEASTQSQPQDIDENPDYVTVTVDAFNTYRVTTVDWDEEAPSEQELLRRLREARRGDSQGRIPKKLLVQANGEALHEKVVTALDAGTAVGMEEVQLMTVEDDE